MMRAANPRGTDAGGIRLLSRRLRGAGLAFMLVLGLAGTAGAQNAVTFSFSNFSATSGESITGSFTATPDGAAVGTTQKYNAQSLVSIRVNNDDYSDVITDALFQPISVANGFTWDTATDSVTATESRHDHIIFGFLTDPAALTLLLRANSARASSFRGTRGEQSFQFTGTSGVAATLTLDTSTPSLDVDGNGTVGLLTDGLLLVRYLIGTRGAALTNLALASDAHADRDTHQEIAAYLQGLVDGDVLDVDGNGTVGLLTDGLLIVRYLIDIRGPELTNLALASDARADRNEPEEITAYLDGLMPPE